MKLFHGCTVEYLEYVGRNGWQAPTENVWTVSYPEMAYFWVETIYDDLDYSLASKACEQAGLTAAFIGSTHEKLVAIEYDFEDDSIEPDDSCQYMSTEAVQIPRSIVDLHTPKMIWLSDGYYTWARAIWLTTLVNRDAIDLWGIDRTLIDFSVSILENYKIHEDLMEHIEPYECKYLLDNWGTDEYQVHY